MSRHTEKRDCDICGFTYERSKLRKNKGLLVCSNDYDIKIKKKPFNLRFGSPRANSDSTDVVESPTIFTITAAGGITSSHSINSETSRGVNLEVGADISFGSAYYMQIVGDGVIDITADPQIAAGSDGDILTLEGTSDTNTVKLENGTGLSLISGESYIIKDNYIMTLVYDLSASLWREASRGIYLN